MRKKYNIALLPTFQKNELLKVAQNFKEIADTYVLSETSWPHITLRQFWLEENQAYGIWNKVCTALQEHSITLELKDFSCIAIDKIFWVSLMPDKGDVLTFMHQAITKILGLDANNNYDPHLTLVSSKDLNYKSKTELFERTYSAIKDSFALAMGECDEVGQFIKIIYQCKDSPSKPSSSN
jgi:2'-5' RNA ligase